MIPNKNAFNPNKKNLEENLFLDKWIISPDKDVIVSLSNNFSKKTTYTKNNIVNLCVPNTLSKYEITEIDNKSYMILECKSGDYMYAGEINCYYVLEKIN